MANYVFGAVQGVFTIEDGGPSISVGIDEVWNADDPAVVARPEFFKDAPTKVQTSGLPAPKKAPAKKAAAKK